MATRNDPYNHGCQKSPCQWQQCLLNLTFKIMTVRNHLKFHNNGCYLWPGVFRSDQWPVPPRRTGRAWHRDTRHGGRLTYPPCSLSSSLETTIHTCSMVNFFRFIPMGKQISVLINTCSNCQCYHFKITSTQNTANTGNFHTTVLFLIQFPSLSMGGF